MAEIASILIVDDNEANCEMLQMRLANRGCRAETAFHGRQALELLARADFDIVVLDIMMPEISGFEVLKMIREKHTVSDLPVIMATAKDQSHDIVEALELGANDYVTKPIDFPVLWARIRAQIALKRLSEQKDSFLSIASHDLKSPVSVIRGYAHLLKVILKDGDGADFSHHREILARMERQTQLMERIITDFLDFHAIENGQLKLDRHEGSLEELIERVIQLNEPYAAAKDMSIGLKCEPLPPVLMDCTRVEQVLVNYLSNAMKFNRSGTQILVSCAHEDGHVIVSVSDNGPGLAAEDMNKLFIKFARLSNRSTGDEKSSGLGLSICKELVEMHGGTVGARNNPEHGATFWFKLPLAGDTRVHAPKQRE